MNDNKPEIFDNEDLGNSQEKINQVAQDLGKQTKRFIKDKQNEYNDLKEAFCEHIKAHPIRSILLGFAAGMLISKLFGNK